MFTLVLFFACMLAVSFAIVLWAFRPSREHKLIHSRINAMVLAGAQTGSRSLELVRKPEPKGWTARIDGFIDGWRIQPALALLLLQAQSDSTPGKVIATSVATAAGAACVVLFFGMPWPVALLVLLPGAFVPTALLRWQRDRRVRKFDAALPDAIDLLARALKAGHSVASAIEVVALQGTPPASAEFAEVFRSQNFGLPFRDAILQLAVRNPSKDLRFLVTAMLVQKETGGNLTEILDRTTHIIRERLRIQGEVRVKTAQGRLTGLILASLPVILGVLINIINPGYAGPLFHDPLGHELLWAGAGLIGVGSFLISRIVKIEV